MLGYLLDAFAGPAGPFMYALLAVLAFAITVAVERTWILLRFRVNVAAVLQQAEAMIREGKAPQLGVTPLEKVVAEGLRWSDPELAWEAMSAAAIDAELQLRRRVAYLSTVASIATMLGLFGTVYGLILAFGALGDVGAAERAAQLSEGSATAMATTAFGLFVAIPAMFVHSIIDAQVREMLGQIEGAATRVVLLWKLKGKG